MSDAHPFGLPDTGPAILDLARAAVRHAVDSGGTLQPVAADLPQDLMQPGACFITLERSGKLRGCIGSLTAREPLAENIADNSHGAARRDPRFPAVHADELDELTVSVSILCPLEPFPFTSEADLISKLRPGIDGLVLEKNGCRGTFLPQVWDDLPDPAQFVSALKTKSGLDAAAPLAGARAWRYRTIGLGPKPVLE